MRVVREGKGGERFEESVVLLLRAAEEVAADSTTEFDRLNRGEGRERGRDGYETAVGGDFLEGDGVRQPLDVVRKGLELRPVLKGEEVNAVEGIVQVAEGGREKEGFEISEASVSAAGRHGELGDPARPDDDE